MIFVTTNSGTYLFNTDRYVLNDKGKFINIFESKLLYELTDSKGKYHARTKTYMFTFYFNEIKSISINGRSILI